MTSGTPWSVKGIDPKAREVAKDLARRSGMTLGEWLNRMILEDEAPEQGLEPPLRHDDGPDEITSQAYFEQRPAPRTAYYETPRRAPGPAPYAAPQERPARFEAPQHPADEIGRVALALDRLTQRIEQSEGRTGLAISGVEQSVREAVARIEAAEREHIAVAARFEGAFDAAQTEHEKLAERLRRVEKDAAGPRSVEALHALEVALGKVANHLYEGEARTRESLEALEARLDRGVGGPVSDPGALIEEVIAKVASRLGEAEGRTAEALQGLGQAFASLDNRLRAVEEQGGGGGDPAAVEDRLEALAADLTAKVEASRAEIAQKIQASADGRFDRMERTLGEMAEHVRQAEQTSAQAIERMGQEVLTIADTLNRRVQAAENRSADAIEQVGGEMARIAQAVETRLGRADSVHAEALERLGAEIARITERLTERMGAAERRSAQAIDDVGEQVARVTERIQQRQDRASEELSERIRQSEERTVRLLSEARDTIDRGLAENQRRMAEQLSPQRLVREEPEGFHEDPFPGFGPAEPAPERQATRPQPAATRRDLGPFLAEIERPNFEASDFEAADDFVRIEEEPAEAAAPLPPQDEPHRAAPEAPLDLAEPAPGRDADPFAPQALAAANRPPERDRLADTIVPDEIEAEVEEIDDPSPFARQAPASPQGADGRPLSTREVIEQARAAARAAASSGDHKKAKADKPARVGKPGKPIAEKTSGFSLFSGFGQKPKRRAGATLQTALLITGGAAFLSLGAAGMIIAAGEPGGKPPQRVADALDAGKAGEIQSAEADTTPFGDNPRVSVALAPQPLATQAGAVAAAAQGQDLDALYRAGTRSVEANQAGGVELLRQAANLGHSPSQFYLSKLYEDGRGGLAKDPVEARRWTERAAENGNRQAMHNLAIAYVDGKGGPKNSATAAQWFRRAADLGLVDSQYNLAALHEQGLGVARNAAEAYKWYLIAARTGDEEARAAAARVRGQLTPEARVVAERAAQAFVSPAAPAPSQMASASSASVSMAQRALSRLRYYNGPTDGLGSPALKGAIEQYQRDQGLNPTGALDAGTIERLSVFTR